MMKSKIWIYLSIVLVGCMVLCWPEQHNTMVIKLSEAHGPSALDVIGLAILMLGYLPMIAQVVRRWPFIQLYFGKSKSILLLIASISGLGMIALALYFSFEWLLWLSIAISTVAQAILIYGAYRVR